jgi:hypothetical protein
MKTAKVFELAAPSPRSALDLRAAFFIGIAAVCNRAALF